MRHKKGNKKLGKPTDQRIALLRSLVKSFFEYEKIKTTSTRAKEARCLAEKIITLGKDGSLHARRKALQILPHKDVVKKVFDNISKSFVERNGGYTRIVRLGLRRGDAAEIVMLELVN